MMSGLKADRSADRRHACSRPAMGDAISHPKHGGDEKLQCDRCENVHSCKCVREILHVTRTRTTELAGYNELLATDCGIAHRRVVALEAALESARRFPTPDNARLQHQLAESENARRLQSAEIARIKQRLCGSETERGMQIADIAALKLQLRESENARLAAVRRVEGLQRTHNIALHQGVGARASAQTAQAAINAERPRFQNLLEQTRADAEELADDNQMLVTDSEAARNRIMGLEAALQTSRRLREADIVQMKRQLRESETARIVAVRRAEELQHAQNDANRRTFAANTALNMERPRVENILKETRAHVAEMEQENEALIEDCEAAHRKVGQLEEALAATRRSHAAQIVRLQRQLAECNSARVAALQRNQQFRETHDVALRHGADARAAAQTAQAAINVERPRIQNLLEQTRADAEELADENQLLATDSEAARNRVRGLEAALRTSQALRQSENVQLQRQLRESETARIVAVRRAEELQRATNGAHRRSVAANAALSVERPRVENILDETRARSNEMEHEIEALATDREAAHRRIVELERQLAQNNSTRAAAVLRAQRLQEARNVALRHSVNARAAAQTAINTERPHFQNMLDQTRATADELADDNDSLAADAESLHKRVVELEGAVEASRRSGNSEIVALRQQLRESENARLSTLRQLEQLRNAHNMVLRQTTGARAAADAELSAMRSSIQNSLDETRADADELEEENSALAMDWERQIVDINRLRLQLRECENARTIALRRVEELERRHDETRGGAEELEEENDALATDRDVQIGDITALRLQLRESENARIIALRRVEELQRRHNESRAHADMQAADITALRRRLRESENAKLAAVRHVEQLQLLHNEARAGSDMQFADTTALRQRLHESENARLVALRRVEELEQLHDETRGDASELEEENDTLATDRDMQIGDITALRQRLHECENARLVAVRRVQELEQHHDETRGDASELEEENDALAMDCDLQIGDINALSLQLRESENARLVLVRRVEELQRSHNEARAGANMQAADTTALRQRLRECENARLVALRRVEELEQRHDETRGDASELEEENDALAMDRDMQIGDITALRQRLQESENARLVAVRRVEELEQRHDETRGDASELEEENDALAMDRDVQISDINALSQQLRESENARLIALGRVEELQRRHNESRADADMRAADITALRQRLHESENARLVALRRVEELEQRHDETRGDASELEEENDALAMDRDVQIGDITALSLQLRDSENARIIALRRAEELQQRHNESRANADMQAADNTALRRRLNESENARLVAERRVEELQRSHNEARANADMQAADITALRQRLHESENARLVAVRRVEELQHHHDETRGDADELDEENDALAADCDMQIADITALRHQLHESENARLVAVRRVGELERSHNETRANTGMQAADISALRQRLHEAENARLVAVRRVQELEQHDDETRGGAEVLEEENDALASDRDVQIGDINALGLQLRESENARLVALGRIEELQRRHNESRANADMLTTDITALRERLHESENARLAAVRRAEELQHRHDETRGDADELEEENDALAAGYDMQIADITTLRQRLQESENARLLAVRRVEELERNHDDACAHADELEEENDALATDCETAHARLAELQQTLLSTQRTQNANIVQLRQRWTESENARHLQVTENVQLKRQLCESNAARVGAVRRAEALQQSHNLALRQTAGIRVAAQAAINVARIKVQNLQQANAALNVRCGAFMQQQARLIASLASVAHELDVARGHARAMKRIAKMLSSMPPKQAVAAVRAARAEAREARIRERSLAFAKRALELANRAERHRIEYERAFREEATRSLGAKAKDADAALNELRAEYRVVVGECATLRRRFADARDDAEDARARARQLEKTNSSLATQLGAAGEAARAASVELGIAERTAAQSRGLTAKVARLRARCGELAATNANANEAEMEEEDTGEDGTVCVICLDVLAEGESVVRLNCGHVFHCDCIMQCLSRMRVPSCPLDRIPVTVEPDQLSVSTWSVNDSPASERVVEAAIVEEEA